MSQNHPNDNIYSILGKLDALKPTTKEVHDAKVQAIRESVESQGSILKGLREVNSVERRLAEQFATESDFSKMSKAIQKTGKSKASADAITAAAGREKLGQKEMTRRAVAGKKKAAHEGIEVKNSEDAMPPEAIAKMNKQHQDYYAANPHLARKGGWNTSVGDTVNDKGQKKSGLATRVTPLTPPSKVTKKSMTPFEESKQGVAEGFPTVADAKADHEKKEKEKGTGKFEKKTNPESGGTVHTRKSSTYDDGGKDKDMKKADKKEKSVKESMQQVQQRFLMEANFRKMADDHGMTMDECMSTLNDHYKNYKMTGECSNFLRDCMDMHKHNKMIELENSAPKMTPPPVSTVPAAAPLPTQKPGFMDRAKSMGQKALNTLGHPSDDEMLDKLRRDSTADAIDEELNELAKLAGLTMEDADKKPDADKDGIPDWADKNPNKAGGDEDRKVKEDPEPEMEGNAFGNAVQNAKKDGIQPGEKIKVGGKEYPVKEAQELIQMMKIAGLDYSKLEEALAKDEKTYGNTEVDEPEEPVNSPKPEYKSMKQSTMGPGEGDPGEKNMYGGAGDNKMTQAPNNPARPVKSVKEAFMAAELAAEYESIKKPK